MRLSFLSSPSQGHQARQPAARLPRPPEAVRLRPVHRAEEVPPDRLLPRPEPGPPLGLRLFVVPVLRPAAGLLQRLQEAGRVVEAEPPPAGLLHRGHPGLHRPGGVPADRVRRLLRLVERRGHHVRDAHRVPALLLGKPAGRIESTSTLNYIPCDQIFP